jgi:hypothetical protein
VPSTAAEIAGVAVRQARAEHLHARLLAHLGGHADARVDVVHVALVIIGKT